jgi:hypothetical protein
MAMVKKIFNNTSFYIMITFLLLGIVFLVSGFINDKEEERGFFDRFKDQYSIHALPLPDTLEFAGETVPVNYFDVRESLDRELLVNTYWQSHTLLLLKRGNRHLAEIESILKEHEVPVDLKYIPVIESELTNAVSPSGAVGVWQFLEGTAKDYGLEVNNVVDERYHIKKSTEAACNFLKDAYEKFGSWTLAAASYNFGRKAVSRQLKRQGADSYYNLVLNEETARYVYRILAIKLIFENPDRYGFNFNFDDLYHSIPTKQVEVDSSVKDFPAFAAEHGINYKLLKIFNPWLRQNYLTNKRGKTYLIEIPEENYRDYQNILNTAKQSK